MKQFIRWAAFAMCFGSTAASFGYGPEADQLLTKAATLNQSVDGYLFGQRVRAVPVSVGKDRCTRVGLIYSDSRGRHGPRIDNFTVCGNEVHELNDVAPALPDGRQFQEMTGSTMRYAVIYGQRSADFDGYVINAVRITQADAQGCAFVETTISEEGLLVANSTGRVCLQ